MMRTRDYFRPYIKGDIQTIWETLRDEDHRELVTGGFENPTVLEDMMLLHSHRVRTWDTEEGPVAVLGVTRTDDPDVGYVWALASQLATPRWRFAARHTQPMLDVLGRGLKVLANYKDTRNIQQINWLKRVGFTFINTHSGVGANYHEFVRIIK